MDPALKIDVAYNVSGPFLPPDQRELEEFYAWELEREQHVRFDNLYAFNNYALGRFANQLKREGKFDYYLDLLSENYNGAVVARMMCRSQVNVDYDGRLYDCEVNHVLGLPLDGPRNVRDLVDEPLGPRTIATLPRTPSATVAPPDAAAPAAAASWTSTASEGERVVCAHMRRLTTAS